MYHAVQLTFAPIGNLGLYAVELQLEGHRSVALDSLVGLPKIRTIEWGHGLARNDVDLPKLLQKLPAVGLRGHMRKAAFAKTSLVEDVIDNSPSVVSNVTIGEFDFSFPSTARKTKPTYWKSASATPSPEGAITNIVVGSRRPVTENMSVSVDSPPLNEPTTIEGPTSTDGLDDVLLPSTADASKEQIPTVLTPNLEDTRESAAKTPASTSAHTTRSSSKEQPNNIIEETLRKKDGKDFSPYLAIAIALPSVLFVLLLICLALKYKNRKSGQYSLDHTNCPSHGEKPNQNIAYM